MRPAKALRGFTLIETLVALVVAAVAAAVIAAMVRGLYDHAQRQARVESQVLELINLSAKLTHLPWRDGLQVDEGQELTLQPTGLEIPVIKVANFQLREGMPLPPRNIAYTPFQLFSVSGTLDDRQTLHFLAPALPPPPGTSLPSAESPDPGTGAPSSVRQSPVGKP